MDTFYKAFMFFIAVHVVLLIDVGIITFYNENFKQKILPTEPPKNQNNAIYNELAPQKINITIKNGADNELTCENYKNNKPEAFLLLNGKEQISLENVKKGEYIGCSFKIDARAATMLHWFTLTSSGTYTLLFEKIEYKTSQGPRLTEGAVVVSPNGQRELPVFPAG